MKMRLILLCACAGSLFAVAGFCAADVTNVIVTSAPVYVPDMSHANEALPEGVLVWNNFGQQTNVAADTTEVHFAFSFTNISSGTVAIAEAHASCHCTVTELPPTPWIIPAGSNGVIGATVSLADTSGMVMKSITISTDKGFQQLNMIINILPRVIPTLSDAERARGVEIAKADRQAVFKGDCASCHVPKIEGKYGQSLYGAVCGNCHDNEHRAAMVPDLHNLKTPTNDEFWRTWIAHGKAGTLMPAFATAEGGPLNDMQIGNLATYLNSTIPSHVPPPQ